MHWTHFCTFVAQQKLQETFSVKVWTSSALLHPSWTQQRVFKEEENLISVDHFDFFYSPLPRTSHKTATERNSFFPKQNFVPMTMTLLALLVIASFQVSSTSVINDPFKSLSDISFECPTSCDLNELSKVDAVKILPTVPCDANEARWDFKVTVRQVLA